MLRFQVLTSGVQDSDLASVGRRIKRYAHYVKSVGYEARRGTFSRRNKDTVIHPTALISLAVNSRIPSPLFPNAERIFLPCFTSRPMEAILYPAVVLSSSIRHVIITTDGGMDMDDYDDEEEGGTASNPELEVSWKAILNHLVEDVAQGLASFQVAMYHEGWVSRRLRRINIPPLNSSCNRLSSLRVLDTGHFIADFSTVAALSQLPSLEELSIAAYKCGFATNARVPSPVHLLPALSRINMTETCRSAGVNLLLSFRAPKLEYVELKIFRAEYSYYLEDGDSGDSLDDAFKALSANHNNIRTIKAHEEPSSGVVVDLCVTGSTFEGLKAQRNLQVLEIGKSYSYPNITDENLVEMFSYWPCLLEFVLHDPSESDDGIEFEYPVNTLAGVSRALEHTPNLQKLGLSINTEIIPADIQGETSRRPHTALKSWDLYKSPIQSCSKVGKWMKSHFPNLDTLTYLDEFVSTISVLYPQGYLHESSQMDMMMVGRWNGVVRLLREQ